MPQPQRPGCIVPVAGELCQGRAFVPRALEIRRAVLGEKHPDNAISLNNLAALYDSQGNSAKAEPLYRQALEIRKEVLAEKHPDYAPSLSTLADLYESQRSSAKAEPLYRRARKLQGCAGDEASRLIDLYELNCLR